MQAVQKFAEFDYVCLCDRDLPEAQQTVWTLKSLTVEQEAFLDDNIQGANGLKYGTNILSVLNMGLHKVRNFKDGKKDVKLERDKDGFEYPGRIRAFKEGVLDKVAIQERRELAAKIRNIGVIEEEDAKNS